jgi:hypothetical protein
VFELPKTPEYIRAQETWRNTLHLGTHKHIRVNVTYLSTRYREREREKRKREKGDRKESKKGVLYGEKKRSTNSKEK